LNFIGTSDVDLLVSIIFDTSKDDWRFIKDDFVKAIAMSICEEQTTESLDIAKAVYESPLSQSPPPLIAVSLSRFTILVGKALVDLQFPGPTPEIIISVSKREWKYFHIIISELMHACISPSADVAETIANCLVRVNCDKLDHQYVNACVWISQFLSCKSSRDKISVGARESNNWTFDLCLVHDDASGYWAKFVSNQELVAAVMKIPILSPIIKSNCAIVIEALSHAKLTLNDVGRVSIALADSSDEVKKRIVSGWVSHDRPVDVITAVCGSSVHAWWPFFGPLIDQLIEVEKVRSAKDFTRLGKLSSVLCLSQKIDILRRVTKYVSKL
jgi:hypothetical protein